VTVEQPNVPGVRQVFRRVVSLAAAISAFVGAALAVSSSGVAQDMVDPDKPDLTGVTIVTHKINDSMYMLEATRDTAGNIGVLVGDDGILIVDDQFAELTPQIEAALERLGPGKLQYILNTHHHSDHSDGNALLSANGDALIVAHDQTRFRLLSRDSAHWPDITFGENLSIYFGGEHVRLIAIPGGHTDNDVIVLFESMNVVHLGDLMNAGISSFPLADLEAGGNALKILENVTRLLTIVPDGATIIPGHGPLTNKNELYRLHEMLSETIAVVRAKRMRGIPIEDIQAEGFSQKYAEWGQGYTSAGDWIAMIYNSLPAED